MQDVVENFFSSNLMEIHQKNKDENEFNEIDINIEKDVGLEKNNDRATCCKEVPTVNSIEEYLMMMMMMMMMMIIITYVATEKNLVFNLVFFCLTK